METSNQFNPRCVCGGSTENPNDDCERCQLLAELARLQSQLAAETKRADEAEAAIEKHGGSLLPPQVLKSIYAAIDSLAAAEDGTDVEPASDGE